jgi:membrane-associated protease RseP (regulator of RpoE activity)
LDQSPNPSHADNLKPLSTPPGGPPPEGDADSTPPSALTPSTWVILLILAVIVVLVYRNLGGLEGLWKGTLVVFGVGFVIFVHELGHFLAAKWCDVHVQTFSIGFGPAFPGCSFRRGETTYKLAVLPLGGYVNMVGEGPEADEDEHYPRSFKNKTVGQRMLIISAGVIMNVLLGAVGFILVFTLHGIDRPPAVVGTVDPGSPIWQKGIPTGSNIVRIAGNEHPVFDDLKQTVVFYAPDEAIPFTFVTPGRNSTVRQVDLVPRRDENDSSPVIGLLAPSQLRLIPPIKGSSKRGPVTEGSAAAAARRLPLEPGEVIVACSDPKQPDQLAPLDKEDDYAELARRLRALAGKTVVIEVLAGKEKLCRELPPEGFEWEDRIVGCTRFPQEGKYNPFQVDSLPPDPRHGGDDHRDPFVFHERLVQLAGQPLVVQVRRKGASADAPPVNLFVPPAFHRTFGMRMKMGKVAGVREGSPAEQAGVQKDDLLSKVKMVDEAGKTLYEDDPKKGLDPERLPDELRQKARTPGKKKVILTVRRPEASGDHNESRDLTLPAVEWQQSWDADDEVPITTPSPLAIPQLGLAYWVTSQVVEVHPGSAAEAAGLKANDEIREIRFKQWNRALTELTWSSWIPLAAKRQGKDVYDCWARAFYGVQIGESPEVEVKVSRDGAELKEPIGMEAREDISWPLADRGLLLRQDFETQKAGNLGEALVMGCNETIRFIKVMYLSLRVLATGRVSHKNVGGPLAILDQGFTMAGDWNDLIFFLAAISINLAVVNFLPIPVLDGGHMVFLIYERLRGRPPSENIRIAATYAGLALILLLMVFVWYQDIRRHWFGK